MVRITNTGETVTEEDLQENIEIDTPNNTTESSANDTPESEDNGDEPQDEEIGVTGNVTQDEIARKAGVLLTRVGLIGAQEGTGKKALLNFAATIVEGAMDKAISEKDAQRFYKKFREASDKKAALESGVTVSPPADAKSIKQQAAKMLPLIKLGHTFRDTDEDGTGDAKDIVRRATNLHLQLMASPDEKKLLKLKSTYPAILAIAVAQLDEKKGYRGMPMNEQQMRAVLQGEEKIKTGADYVLAALKSAEQARKGKDATDNDPAGRDPVDHDRLYDAIAALKDALADLDPDLLNDYLKKTSKGEVDEAVAAFRSSYRVISTR